MSFDNLGGSSLKIKGVNTYGNMNTRATNYFNNIKTNNSMTFEKVEEIDYNQTENVDLNIKTFTSESSIKKNKKNNTASNKIWSSFYGGSAKHTKDHLGMFINKFVPGSLKLDKHDRTVAYDKNGNKYKNGIVVEDKDGNKYLGDNLWKDKDGNVFEGENPSKSKLVQIRDNIDNKLEKITAYEEDFDGTIKSKYGNAKQTVKDFLENDVDTWAKNTKLAQKIQKFNSKYDNWDNPTGSQNQYRVGQNWAYGSVVLDSGYANWEGNVVQFSGKIGDDKNYLQGEIDILHAEAQAGWELGPDHFVASASAEASLLHVEGSGKWTAYEDEYAKFGANGTVKADVAKVYANGKVGLGLYKGADGNTHLDAGIQGSIGADLCSATASGTADLGPVSVTGTATVKIGIGAQANVGFEDGKLNFHLGLAFGVGVELGFSLDVNKGFNAAKDFVSNVYDKVLEEPIKNTVKAVKTGAKKVKNYIKTGAKKAYKWVCSWF